MPFEVYPVENIVHTSDPNDARLRTPEKVADEIKAIYERVAQNAGRVVGEHFVPVRTFDRTNSDQSQSYLYTGRGYTMIVAQFSGGIDFA